MQRDEEEPRVAPVEDQTPMDNEDIEMINSFEQTFDVRDILNSRNKFEAHIDEIDSDLQFKSTYLSDIISTLSLSSEACPTVAITGTSDSLNEVSGVP